MTSNFEQFVDNYIKETRGTFFGILSTKDIENRKFKNNDCFIISIPKEKKIIDGKEVEVDGEYRLKEGSVAHDRNYLMYFDDIGFTIIGNFKESEDDNTIHTYKWNDASIDNERVIKVSDFQKFICYMQKKFKQLIPINIIDD